MLRLLKITPILLGLGLAACANDGPKSPASQPPAKMSTGPGQPMPRTAAMTQPTTTRSVSPDGRVVETTTSSTFASETGGTVNGVPIDPNQPYPGRSAQLPTFSSLTIVDPNAPPPAPRPPHANLPPLPPGGAAVTQSTTRVTEEAATTLDTPSVDPMVTVDDAPPMPPPAY